MIESKPLALIREFKHDGNVITPGCRDKKRGQTFLSMFLSGIIYRHFGNIIFTSYIFNNIQTTG
jgi:hypothetical protein